MGVIVGQVCDACPKANFWKRHDSQTSMGLRVVFSSEVPSGIVNETISLALIVRRNQ